ncbi:MAG: hypothetical protein R6V85_07565 [Polyangia bacterium]
MVPLYYGYIADYASNLESNQYLYLLYLLDASGYLELVVPGSSVALDISPYDTQYSPGFESPLVAARVSENADSSEMEVPALLLNCGMHAYEWIPQEVVVSLAILPGYFIHQSQKGRLTFPPSDRPPSRYAQG